MAIDFSELQGTPAHDGRIDFSAIGGIPAVGGNEPTDETTALGAAGRGAVGMIPLGEQAYSAVAGMAEHKPYTQERKELEAEIEADKANHGVARLAGQVAGIAAPALLTGGATAPESMAAAAGEGALVGGGFGAGNAIDTLAEGGSGVKAAGDVALGAGLGALGGAAGQKVSGMMKEAIPGIENYAAKKAASAVGLESKELGNMTQAELRGTGEMLLDKGIVKPGASTQEMFDTAKAIHEHYGDQIGQIGNQATELGLTTDTKPMLNALEEKYKLASQLQNPDEMRNANFYKKGMADIITMANRNGAERVTPDILTAQPNSFITFDQLQQLKKSYGNSAFMNGAVKNPAAADVYGQLSAGQKAIVNKVGATPGLPAQLKDAMAGYAKLHPVVEGLQDVLGRERAGNMPAKGFGMMGKLVGQMPGQSNPVINGLTSLGLLGMGHPMWAVGAATASLQNPRTMSSAAAKLAEAIPGAAGKLPEVGSQIVASRAPKAINIQNMGESTVHHAVGHVPLLANEAIQKKSPTTLNMEHPAMAPWKQTFDKNAASAQNEGEKQKAHAVTDFILSQRDPAYAAAKQKVADNPTEQNDVKNAGKKGMADGGVVSEEIMQNGDPAFGSTLEGLAKQLKNPTHEAPPPAPEKLPTENANTPKFHQPFNSDMEDKLRAFFEKREEDDGESK